MSADDFRQIGRPGSEFKALDQLRKRLADKGLDLDRLPKLSSIDNPPACFVYRAGGDVAKASRAYVEWLRLVAETDDIDYRLDMPGEVNYCRDCTPAFKAEAEAAGECSFPHVVFETVNRGDPEDEEIVGVSRTPRATGQFIYEGMSIDEPNLPEFIKDLLRERANQD